MDDLAHDLAAFITAAPTPYHAVAEAVRRLDEAGFVEQSRDRPVARRARRPLPRARRHASPPGSQGAAPRPLRVYLAHTDSPTLKVKPHPDTGRGGWRQLGVEVYGGALWNSWLDRDLGLAGRLALLRRLASCWSTSPARSCGCPSSRSTSTAHVNQGLILDAQQHLLPIWGLGAPAEGDLVAFLAGEAGVDADEIAAHDLVVHDLTPPARLGEEEELLAAPRLDNLCSCTPGWRRWRRSTTATSPRSSSASTTRRSAARPPPARPGPLLENLLDPARPGGLRRPRPGVRGVALPVGGHRPRRPPQLPRAARPRPPHAAEPGARAEGQRDPALRHRRPRRRGLVPRVPRPPTSRRRCSSRRTRCRAARRSGRSPRPGWASARSTSASRCCPCTPPGSCAGWPTRVSSPPRRRRSSATRADAPFTVAPFDRCG